MKKFCGKCGTEMTEDDFLCPKCGAIWGDRVYVVPTELETEEEVREEASPLVQESPKKKSLPKMNRLIFVIAALCLVLAVALFWISADSDLWGGQNNTSVTTDPKDTTTIPPYVEPQLISYTVKVVDPNWNPVADVVLAYPTVDPAISSSTQAVTTDENGVARFQFPDTHQASIWITQVPDNYLLPSVDTIYYFPAGVTELIVILEYVEVSIQPLAYSVMMLDPMWLYEAMPGIYLAGEMVEVKIAKVSDVGYMMLLNGVEIPSIMVDGPYILYSFIMPEEDVTLDLKIIADRTYEGYIRDYYLQFPNTEDVEVIHYYGQYGMADVIMLSTASTNSDPCQINIGKYCFKYPNQNVIQVLVEGRYLSFYTAYESGFFVQDDLDEIYQLHTQYYWDLYIDEVEPIA